MNLSLFATTLPLLAAGTWIDFFTERQQMWQLLWGAATGACFYILLRGYRYLADRTYDPKYNAAYITRFFCGIVAGFILAQVSIPFVGSDTRWSQVAPGTIALLGGFAVEAVEEILKRMVEVLLALFRGSGADRTEAQVEQTKTKLEAAQSVKAAALRRTLTAIPTAQLDAPTREALAAALAQL